ncbi:MAG: hypothetical protein V3R25_06070 [Nitrosomonadaceae bacterium]
MRQPDDHSWEEEHIFHLDKEIETLKSLLERAVSAIGEAGYEDFDNGLMQAIDSALNN